ncbi:MAG: DUF3015 domain-containing protein [Candidatus Omnitrophica bacterium]|nr:DUF3015 domain-containing protein [Candidatus Omnitrophota bacterium]
MKKFFVSVIIVLCAFAVFVQPVMARSFAEIYTECGLGAMLFPNKKHAALAVTTNIVWDWGTTAISSQLSSPDSCLGGKDMVATFIYHSYDSIEQELASGSGEYLDELVELVGDKSTDKQEFVSALRKDFTELVAVSIYTNRTRYEKAEALYNLIYKQA